MRPTRSRFASLVTLEPWNSSFTLPSKNDPHGAQCAFTHWTLRTSVSRRRKLPAFPRPNGMS